MSYSDANGRAPIPAEVRRRVLVEAGQRCAIPACRHIEVDIHHIVPWAQRQAHEYENLIALCPNCHRRADRGDIDRKSLKLYKANLRFVHDKYSQIEMDVLFELWKKPNESMIWHPFAHLLLKRIIESELIRVHRPSRGISVGGMRATPDYLYLTDKGKDFIDSLGVTEL
jgi:hypothetical protein